MAGIKKKGFDSDDFKKKFSSTTKYKDPSFYYCGDAFLKATGLPGPIMGGINMLLGHSNTSKTTALILAAADAQKKGHLPVFIITEKKWNWEHAVQLGLQADKDENGEWVGDFIFNDSFEYIEQITDFMNEVIDAQGKGDLNQSILFLWDSVGSVPCKMTYDGKGGKQHNAAALADKIGMGLHSKISKSKKEDYPTKENPLYITLIVVNQPWVDLPDNPFGQPEIKAKGGEALWLASSFVFLFGNQKKAGINHIDATKDGRKVGFAIRTKISVLKNHVNGIQYKDGKVIAVPTGYIDDTKEALEEYKKEYSKEWKDSLGNVTPLELFENEEENIEE
jgi:hypothetical protein